MTNTATANFTVDIKDARMYFDIIKQYAEQAIGDLDKGSLSGAQTWTTLIETNLKHARGEVGDYPAGQMVEHVKTV